LRIGFGSLFEAGGIAMTTLTDEVRRLLTRELATFAKEVEALPDDASLWKALPGVLNSVGNLALHADGNLRHYVGAVLGGTGYRRDRDAEFRARSGSRAALARQLRETSGIVERALASVSPAVLAAPYPEKVAGVELPCDRFLMHLCSHLALHLGQAGYLRRVLTGDARSTGPLSVRELAEG
jgi:Protein of unknown function (DUF664)